MNRPSVPYRVLYSNDTTNITTCVSPYHSSPGEPFRPEMLRETVKEVAGKVDAHLIQLCTGRVPWHKSRMYPIEEHHRWWSEHYGVPLDDKAFDVSGYHRYLLEGGDILQDFIEACREFGQAAFVSIRLNDSHFIEFADEPGNRRGIHCISRFYVEHPEYRLGTDKRDWYQRNCNWIYPEVREQIFRMIEEQCENYDLDGYELDFQRHPRFFRVEETTLEERRSIMTDFVLRVRDLLDRTRRNGRYRYLSVRIPCFLSMLDDIGVDVKAMAGAGVDIVNVSDHYFTEQDTDFAKIKALLPDTAVYLELCHCLYSGKAVKAGAYDNFTFRRVTDEEFYTTAHLAYAQGARGISLFNFVYYRQHGSEGRGPFNEPPFHVLPRLGDPAWLAKQPQHYILTPGWHSWNGVIQSVPTSLPHTLEAGETHRIPLDLAPPINGWSTDARLRLQTEDALNGQSLTVAFNGTVLTAAEDIREPYPSPYTPLLGDETTLRGWTVPRQLLREGPNAIDVTLEAGENIRLLVADLAVR